MSYLQLSYSHRFNAWEVLGGCGLEALPCGILYLETGIDEKAIPILIKSVELYEGRTMLKVHYIEAPNPRFKAVKKVDAFRSNPNYQEIEI